MMRQCVLLAVVLLPAVGGGQTSHDAEVVELVAARHLLARHPAWTIHLDSAFAVAGTAPGVRGGPRPGHRTRLLADSLRAVVTTERAAESINLLVSDPDIRDDKATVSVTVSYVWGRGPRNGVYETVEVHLTRDANGWKVTRETSLGIT